jgi:hypothetical protein
METYEYRITKHSADAFRKVMFFCTSQGECGINETSSEEFHNITTILNQEGIKGWELVQIMFGIDGMLAFWKRRSPASEND